MIGNSKVALGAVIDDAVHSDGAPMQIEDALGDGET